MPDSLYKHIESKYLDIMDLPPQTVGPFTPVYKFITRRLKNMPLALLVGISFVLVFGLYLISDSALVFLTSILQRGF